MRAELGKVGMNSGFGEVRAGCVGRAPVMIVAVRMVVVGLAAAAAAADVGGLLWVSTGRGSTRLVLYLVGDGEGRIAVGYLWGWRRRMRTVLAGCRR